MIQGGSTKSLFFVQFFPDSQYFCIFFSQKLKIISQYFLSFRKSRRAFAFCYQSIYNNLVTQSPYFLTILAEKFFSLLSPRSSW